MTDVEKPFYHMFKVVLANGTLYAHTHTIHSVLLPMAHTSHTLTHPSRFITVYPFNVRGQTLF